MRALAPVIALALAACSATSNNTTTGSAPNGEANATMTSAEGVASPPGESSSGMPLPPEPRNPVTFTAEPSRVSAGATMALTLTNNAGSPIGYNLCTSAIETPAGTPVRSDRICTMEIRTLDPDKSATYSYELPKTIARGTYRFSARIEFMQSGTATTAKSNAFEVR